MTERLTSVSSRRRPLGGGEFARRLEFGDGLAIEEGLCYEVEYKSDPGRKNAAIRKTRFQVLEIMLPEYGKRELHVSHRPWNEGGSSTFTTDQIVSVREIPRGNADR